METGFGGAEPFSKLVVNFPLSLCCFIILEFCHFAILLFCHFAVLSFCCFVNFAILVLCNFGGFYKGSLRSFLYLAKSR
jgi:hypothetical protein